MRPPKLGTLFALAACLILVVPASVLATPQVGEKSNGLSLCDEQALRYYAQASKQGLDVGRNRVDDGKLLSSGKVIPEPHPCGWRDQLDVMLHPPVVQPEPTATVVSPDSSVASAPAPTSVAPTSVGGTPPEYIAQCESGGDYGAVNPSSGAYGKWQILPSTSAAYGCDMSSPAGQDACAAEIYAAEGASPWACG